MNAPGFNHEGRRVLFIDYHGRDVTLARWRFYLYYAPGMATTHFEQSEIAAMEFLARNTPHCFREYGEFCDSAENMA